MRTRKTFLMSPTEINYRNMYNRLRLYEYETTKVLIEERTKFTLRIYLVLNNNNNTFLYVEFSDG